MTREQKKTAFDLVFILIYMEAFFLTLNEIKILITNFNPPFLTFFVHLWDMNSELWDKSCNYLFKKKKNIIPLQKNKKYNCEKS